MGCGEQRALNGQKPRQTSVSTCVGPSAGESRQEEGLVGLKTNGGTVAVKRSVKRGELLLETGRPFLEQLKSAAGLGGSTPGYVPAREPRTHVRTKTGTVCSGIAPGDQTVETPECLSAHEWINKMWFVHRHNGILCCNQNEVSLRAAAWMNPESTLSGRRPSQGITPCVLSLT